MQRTFILLATRGTKNEHEFNKQQSDCFSQTRVRTKFPTLSRVGFTEDQLLSSSQEKMETTYHLPPGPAHVSTKLNTGPNLKHPLSAEFNLLDIENNEDDGSWNCFKQENLSTHTLTEETTKYIGRRENTGMRFHL